MKTSYLETLQQDIDLVTIYHLRHIGLNADFLVFFSSPPSGSRGDFVNFLCSQNKKFISINTNNHGGIWHVPFYFYFKDIENFQYIILTFSKPNIQSHTTEKQFFLLTVVKKTPQKINICEVPTHIAIHAS